MQTELSNTSTLFTAPAVSVPSISSAAMFVELSIATWAGRKLDKRASADITNSNNAARGVANVNKKLLGDCAELDAVSKFTANVRNIHYSMTMPWSDMGLRLVSTQNYFKYTQQMSALQTEFHRLVNIFLDAYGWEIGQAQVKLGDLFNQDEYPSTDRLREKFRFQLSEMPVPDVGDFRLDINNEAQQLIKQKYADYYTAQLKNAMRDVWLRAHTALSKMSERLDYADKDTKKVFRDSLIENVMDMVDLLKTCNITGDSQMSAIATSLENALLGVTPDALRADDYLRYETKQHIDTVLKALPSLDL